jgi:hypothetical protein
MAWIARVPFRLPQWQTIELGSLDLGEVMAEIVGVGGKNSLVARDIPTEAEARALVPRLAESLRRLALEARWAIEVRETIQELEPVGESLERRYWGDWAAATVYSDDQSVGLETPGEVRILQTMSSGNAAEHMRAAMQAGAVRPRDERLRLGMDLFMDAGFQADPYGAFLLRMTVLEVLADKPLHPEAVQEAISRWKEEISNLDGDDQIANARVSLLGSLEFLRNRSISKSVKELVREKIGSAEAKRVGELYLLRNDIVHEGDVPERGVLSAALEELTTIVRTVLLQRLSEERVSYGHSAGALNPASPIVSGALPTSRGIRPAIDPPSVDEAGVTSV